MQSVPGIVVDRVNVGGSESGQQANYIGKGTTGSQATWNVDGMPLTDMSSLSSPFYYDFDMFSEMNFTTGGAEGRSLRIGRAGPTGGFRGALVGGVAVVAIVSNSDS